MFFLVWVTRSHFKNFKLLILVGHGPFLMKLFHLFLPTICRENVLFLTTVYIKDNASFIETLAMVDKIEMEAPKKSIFPINEGYIHNYLQLFVNFEENSIYDDVGIYAYGPDEDEIMRRFNPIRENIEFNLYPDSVIQLQPDVGC